MQLQLERVETVKNVDVWVSHYPPDGYFRFPNSLVQKKPKWVIGRSMYETSEIPGHWGKHMNRADKIWVPATFLLNSFSKHTTIDKLDVIPLSIDTNFFDPDLYDRNEFKYLDKDVKNSFVFSSVFKIEYRKGYDILLRAFLSEFKKSDKVSLIIHTHLFTGHDERNISNIKKLFNEFISKDPYLVNYKSEDYPTVVYLSKELNYEEKCSFYKASDAFVLPTRGEGFGIPIQEAMTMGIPVIASRSTGPKDFLNEENSYPIKIDKMVKNNGFAGKLYEPSLDHLKQLLRHVYNNREEAKRKGKNAREYMIRYYDNDIVSNKVIEKFNKLQ
jgi:glycosyltransferase involved in cell wall biosynthesis